MDPTLLTAARDSGLPPCKASSLVSASGETRARSSSTQESGRGHRRAGRGSSTEAGQQRPCQGLSICPCGEQSAGMTYKAFRWRPFAPTKPTYQPATPRSTRPSSTRTPRDTGKPTLIERGQPPGKGQAQGTCHLPTAPARGRCHTPPSWSLSSLDPHRSWISLPGHSGGHFHPLATGPQGRIPQLQPATSWGHSGHLSSLGTSCPPGLGEKKK